MGTPSDPIDRSTSPTPTTPQLFVVPSTDWVGGAAVDGDTTALDRRRGPLDTAGVAFAIIAP